MRWSERLTSMVTARSIMKVGLHLTHIVEINIIYLPYFFRIRHHDDLKVICYNVSLWNYSGSGWLRRNNRFIDFTNTIFFCGFPIIILQFKSQNSPTRLCWFCSKELLAILACHNVEPLTCIFLLSVYMWCHLSFLPFNIWLKVLSTIFVYKLLYHYQHQRIKVLLDQMSP